MHRSSGDPIPGRRFEQPAETLIAMQTPDPKIDFEALVHAHHATVFRCALRVLRSEADARDLTQEVFLEVLQRPERFAQARDPAAVLAWTATRKALALLRGDRNRRQREESHAMLERDGALEQQLEDQNESAEVRSLLSRLVAKLPDDLRIALGLRFEEQLTFAAIAEATRCSEPTAHDRVQRALQRLRGDFQRAGLASAIPVLPSLLAFDDAKVPGGLEAQLLSLTKAAVGGAQWLVYAGVLIGAVGLTVAARVAWNEPSPSATAVLAPPSEVASNGNSVASISPAARAADALESPERTAVEFDIDSASPGTSADSAAAANDLQRGRLTGRVIDVNGAPITGVLVQAASREFQGKLPLFHDSQLSDANGEFALSLPISRPAGQAYRLRTTHPDFVSVQRDELLVRADEAPPHQELQLLANSADELGDWELDLYLFDAAGVPVEGAVVRSMRFLKLSSTTTEWIVEDRAASDANGLCVLNGERLGAQRLEIDPSRQGWQTRRIEVGIDRPGAHTEHVQLVPGLTVEGMIATVDGSPLPDDLQLIVTGTNVNDWRYAELGHGGQFRYEGLDPGAFRLRSFASGWSQIDLRDLEAGCAPLALRLKRVSDDRDVGTHMAELHGHLVDAETGAPVLADILDVESIALWDAEQLELSRTELLALHRTQRPYQTMAPDGDWPAPSPDFHETGLEARRYLIAARVAGYAPAFAGPFELGPHDLVNGIRLELERGGSLRGRVVDEDGQGVSGAHLFLAPDSERGRRRLAELDHSLLDEGERSLFECERVGQGGVFLVEHIPTGQPYLLCALSRQHLPRVVGRVEWSASGESVERTIRLSAR